MPAQPHDLLVGLLLVQSLLERRSDAFFQPHGITAAQFNILNLLAHRQGRLEQAALVELLLVGKSSISIVLNRMVRDGLVQREAHPLDRRQTILVLTARGKRLWQKIASTYEENVRKTFGALPASHRQQFLADLKILHNALTASDGSPESASRWDSLFSD